MGRIYLLLLVLLAFTLTSCEFPPRLDADKGYLLLHNHTSYGLWYRIDHGETKYLDEYSSKNLEFDMPEGVNGIVNIQINFQYGFEERTIDTEVITLTSGRQKSYILMLPHGSIQVFNDTDYGILGRVISADSTTYIDQYIVAAHSSQIFPVEVPGSLEFVDSTHVVSHNFGQHYLSADTPVKVIVNDTTDIHLSPTACGLKIWNTCDSLYISQIYISPATSEVWGSNILNGYISPHENYVIPVAPGLWDLKIYDNRDKVYILNTQELLVGQDVDIFFSGSDLMPLYGYEFNILSKLKAEFRKQTERFNPIPDRPTQRISK